VIQNIAALKTFGLDSKNQCMSLLKQIWAPVGETFSDFSSDRCPRLAAALSYYTIFSLAPLLIIVIAVAGLAWGREAVQGELVGQFTNLIGEQGGKQVETMVVNASSQPRTGVIALIVGIATLLFGAIGVFTQLKGALNTVWEVRLKSPGGWRGIWLMIRTYLLSFAMLFVIIFLLLASLVVSTALAAAGRWMSDAMPLPEGVIYALNMIISFAVIMLLFAAMFKILPDVKIAWRDVWIGAAVTAALFTVGKFALGMYLGRSAAVSVYGAAGSVIIILLWVYYASMIFLIGAEFTQVHARRWGSRIEPAPWAEPVPESERANQGVAAKRKTQAGRAEQPQERPQQEPPSGPTRPPLRLREVHRDDGNMRG
jgi:membrane protein